MTAAVAPTPQPRAPWRGRALAISGGIVAVVCFALMEWVDVPLAVAMHKLAGTRFVGIFDAITTLGNGAIWYGVALAGAGLAYVAAVRDPRPDKILLRRRLRAWMFMIVSMAASGLLVNGIKMLVGRGRPSDFFSRGVAAFTPFTSGAPQSWSFPSGHSQSIWAAMLALSWLYPPLRWPCFVLAIAVSASRVIVGAHYPSDVVAGAYLAVAVAYMIRELFARRGISLDLSTARHRDAVG